MNDTQRRQLSIQACKVRMGIVNAVFSGKSGHPGGSLSSADILTYLYFDHMNIDPKNPKNEDRDRFVLSKGHCTPAYYSVLAHRGFFPVETLETFRHVGSILQGHPDMKGIPGVDMSTGSLGQGISAAVGMALGAKLSGKSNRVYALTGDGEHQEGQIWEAAMFAAHNKLDNLCVIVDLNGLQIDGRVADVCAVEPVDKKYEGFGYHVIKINGHNFDEIEAAFKEAETVKGKPSVILATTIKGKDVSFMENQASWHGAAPNAEQYEIAMADLNKVMASLEVAK